MNTTIQASPQGWEYPVQHTNAEQVLHEWLHADALVSALTPQPCCEVLCCEVLWMQKGLQAQTALRPEPSLGPSAPSHGLLPAARTARPSKQDSEATGSAPGVRGFSEHLVCKLVLPSQSSQMKVTPFEAHRIGSLLCTPFSLLVAESRRWRVSGLDAKIVPGCLA